MKFVKNYTLGKRVKTINDLPSMTQQEHEDQLEINKVMDRYERTGFLPLNKIAPVFADLTLAPDFDSMQDKLLQAQRLFLDLPYEVRDEFRTPEELLRAFNNPKGQAKLRAAGILETPPSAKEPVPTAPVAGSGVQPQKGSEGTPAS